MLIPASCWCFFAELATNLLVGSYCMSSLCSAISPCGCRTETLPTTTDGHCWNLWKSHVTGQMLNLAQFIQLLAFLLHFFPLLLSSNMKYIIKYFLSCLWFDHKRMWTDVSPPPWSVWWAISMLYRQLVGTCLTGGSILNKYTQSWKVCLE